MKMSIFRHGETAKKMWHPVAIFLDSNATLVMTTTLVKTGIFISDGDTKIYAFYTLDLLRKSNLYYD